MKTIDFCPAAAAADAVIRLEAVIDAVARLQREAEAAPWGRDVSVQRKLEIVSERLLLEGEAARDRLSAADPVSAAGAMAQLLAAIRDRKVNDDDERMRAQTLEAKATGFLRLVGGLDLAGCARLSGGKANAHQPPAHRIAGG